MVALYVPSAFATPLYTDAFLMQIAVIFACGLFLPTAVCSAHIKGSWKHQAGCWGPRISLLMMTDGSWCISTPAPQLSGGPSLRRSLQSPNGNQPGECAQPFPSLPHFTIFPLVLPKVSSQMNYFHSNPVSGSISQRTKLKTVVLQLFLIKRKLRLLNDCVFSQENWISPFCRGNLPQPGNEQ